MQKSTIFTQHICLAATTYIQTNDCVIWPFKLNHDGYGRFTYKGRMEFAHRVAFLVVHGRWPNKARHTCDVRSCINVRHLIEGTQRDNIRDMIERGRSAKGTMMPQAKLTDDIVRQMRREYIPYVVSTPMLARKYGIDVKNCYNIVTGRAWKHVSP